MTLHNECVIVRFGFSIRLAAADILRLVLRPTVLQFDRKSFGVAVCQPLATTQLFANVLSVAHRWHVLKRRNFVSIMQPFSLFKKRSLRLLYYTAVDVMIKCT